MLQTENNQLLHELNACAIVSNMCYYFSLHGKDVTVTTRCIELSRDCADLCQLASSMLGRGTKEITSILKICAKLCIECADECENFDEEHYQKCARVCRKCAEMCELFQPELVKPN